MKVALVHGYFLHDSGSGIYVRELARALVRLGHEVTLVCQEREPERCDFIDSAYALDESNQWLEPIFESRRVSAGSCRLVRPNIAGELLVYVEGEFPPFERSHVHAFQNAPAEMRTRYIGRNVTALQRTFEEWPPDLVLAQHIIMQPVEVARALAGSAPYVVTEHGSSLNFSVRGSDALVPFAVEGLAGAAHIATVSDGARHDLISWATVHGLSIAEKTVTLPPGIDSQLFAPAADRETAIAQLRELVATLPTEFDLEPDDDIVAYAGSLRPTKGVQHALAAVSLASRMRGRRMRLLVAGDGPARGPLEELARALETGDVEGARQLVEESSTLQSPSEWGDVVRPAAGGGGGPAVAAGPIGAGSDWRAAFLGHLDHRRVAAVFACADVCVAPSVFPEAAALVNVEGLSAGALPLAAYHSGMVDLDDYLADSLGDLWLARLTSGPEFTQRLAESIVHALETHPTKEPVFREELHALALRQYPTWEGTARSYLAMA